MLLVDPVFTLQHLLISVIKEIQIQMNGWPLSEKEFASILEDLT